MSYILDALRRAESERERGSVPTVHSSAAPPSDASDAPTGPRAQLGPWVVAAVATLMLVAALAWQWPARQPAPAPAAAPHAVAAASPFVAPPASAPAAPSPELTSVEPPQPPQLAPAAITTPRSSVPPTTAASDRLPTASELPEALRRELPTVTTGGAMYSDTPAKRMLILNGQIFREGEKVAPQLVLEQIMLKGAVLSFKGQRFSISF